MSLCKLDLNLRFYERKKLKADRIVTDFGSSLSISLRLCAQKHEKRLAKIIIQRICIEICFIA